jgi:2-succinyl-5-enolpyruvyl-6-hydroxy-3-cyclohexene-1-carboxylate synthase
VRIAASAASGDDGSPGPPPPQEDGEPNIPSSVAGKGPAGTTGNLNDMDPTARFVSQFVGGLADLGMRNVALAPGSRNTTLSLAFLAETRISHHTVLDERSAAFFALGAAKAAHLPAAVVSTSGTAAANFLPAVIEAAASRVPLVVLTADRPPELRGSGANQTIDQLKLFGSAVRLFHEAGVPDLDDAEHGTALALRVWAGAADQPASPVHVNLPFREPFATDIDPTPPTGLAFRAGYRSLPPEEGAELAAHLSNRRALIVAGGRQRPGFATAASMTASQARIPIIADIQCRFPSPVSIQHGDLLARCGILDRLKPEVVLRIGAIPTSKALGRWLDRSGVEQLYLDDGSWRLPAAGSVTAYRADPAGTLADLVGTVGPTPAGWLDEWLTVDEKAAAAFHDALEIEAKKAINEPVIARATWQAAPPESIIFAGSSMPIRDLDAFAGPPRADVEIMANRGASGIDGLLSSAAGAAANEGRRVVALAGDLAALHDLNALELIGRYQLPVTVVVINNDGGGIFSFLPQAAIDAERFETVFGTPHGRSLGAIAAAIGITQVPVRSPKDLEMATRIDGPALVEFTTDRSENVAVHERLYEATRRALAE